MVTDCNSDCAMCYKNQPVTDVELSAIAWVSIRYHQAATCVGKSRDITDATTIINSIVVGEGEDL